MDNTVDINEAYKHMLEHPELVRMYEKKCKQYELPERELRLSPQWADWFARAVLTDHWPPAEGLISQDKGVAERYSRYATMMKSIGMADHTVGTHQMKRDRDEATDRAMCLQHARQHGNTPPPDSARVVRRYAW